ncbi:uncharacterized protein Bfra_008637 [Botrytis fragariae]|uniref:Uncharacterized protein n=1 Tax=Botrytis fragariae TaxID=1964551 RepID=A0A8H6AQ58_9HELO|nr:uncharacterized protein Bfra_008637 [Botrytis fragariae]KAF5871614.1 hypothetical protein Bfra_008637 [Botrytis fragariae]
MISKILTFIKNSSSCTDDLIIATYLSRKRVTIAHFAKQIKANIGGRLQKIDRGKALSTVLFRRSSFTGQLKNLLAYLPDGKARNLCRSHLPCLKLVIDSDSDLVGLYDKKDLSPTSIKSNA